MLERGRRAPGNVPTVLLLCALGCALATGCKEEPKTDESAPSTEPSEATEAVDVSFLVKACVDSGIEEKACECVGNQAKADLGAPLVDKMRAAPADDDPALEGYYTGAEIRTVMAWVDGSSDECGLEDER